MPDKKLIEPVGNSNRLTDTEIKKALECCHGQYEADCENCPNKNTCGEIDVIQQTLDLINRLEFKNCQLEKQVSEIQNANLIDFKATIGNYKAEVERLTKSK